MKTDAFIRAAKFIEDGGAHHCCSTLVSAGAGDRQLTFFVSIFKPDSPLSMLLLFWAGYKDGTHLDYQGVKGWTRDDRVVALCLASAIAKTEGMKP